MEKITGHIAEQKMLIDRMASGKPELIAVYGRRRVGKTFLIRTLLHRSLVFEMVGMLNTSFQDQLQNFANALQKVAKQQEPVTRPANWLEAFVLLDNYIDTLPADKVAVVFFDEFPWIHSQKSRFLQAFDHWWNISASKKQNLKVVICGSAASWMIENIVHARGGLHNRVTQRIRLKPFSLGETDQFLKDRNIILDHYQVLQVYMAMGGVPHYLNEIKQGESSVQVIDKLCFAKDGLLKTEFKYLYQSLFAHAEHHEQVVRALARKGKGLTRNEIIKECRLSTGGTTTKILKELEESGFIFPYIPFGKTVKDSIYKLYDEYSLFYLKFVEGAKATGKGTWLQQSQTPSYRNWSDIAFESVCLKHTEAIKKSLGIEGVYTEGSAWRYIPNSKIDQGAQIDLLLDRADRCINICEMKFSTYEFVIDKKYANEIDVKLRVFRQQSGTRKSLFPTMITTYGVKKNEYYLGRIQAEVRMEDLFKQ
jgi:AAA+ ATPase superfamily predicted ATPase